MTLIDVVKWEAGADELVWKFPRTELSTQTQIDSFGAGRHTLSTDNLPLLNKLVNLPFGGQSPFAAEVRFVNRAIPLDLKWGTPTPIQLEIPQYGIVVPVSVFGQMGVRISDPGTFIGTLAGTPGVLELKKAKAAAARQKIEGTNYAQERTFDSLQTGAENTGFRSAGAGPPPFGGVK